MTTATLIVGLCLSVQADGPIVLDGRKQLFLDDYLIQSSRNVTRQIHPARKHPANPVLRPSEPWEGDVTIVYGSVLHEGNKYRMWYYATGGIAYAQSDDGIRWTKPRLGIIAVDGQDTNLVVRRDTDKQQGTIPHFYEIFGVLRDDRDPDPARRYKMGFLSIKRGYDGPNRDPFHGSQRRGLGVAASPDGIHWKLLNNWATDAICDGDTHWMFDPTRQKYVLYGRTKHAPPDVLQAWKGNEWAKRHYWGRAVARVESADFLNWNITQPAKAPVVMTPDVDDPPGTEIYSMLVFPYGAVYIGLVQVFHNQPDACYLDVQLAVSHDSIHFERVGDRRAFIPVGPVGSWDRFNQSVATNAPIAVADELRFYYGGRTYRHSPYRGPDPGTHTGGVGIAAIRRDRFVSLGASFDGGQIVTRPLELKGKCLHLNTKSDFGEAVVEIIDADGGVLARSNPISADASDVPVQWEEGNLQGLSGPVVLRITLRNALLFAIWCS